MATRKQVRVVFDVEHGCHGATDESESFYQENKDDFEPFVEAWVFNSSSDEAVVAGFVRQDLQERPEGLPPMLRKPGVVLIDELGDQMWLAGAGSSGGRGRGGAFHILGDAGFDLGPDGLRLACHYVDRQPTVDPFSPYEQKQNLLSLPGGLSISRMGTAVKYTAVERPEDQSWIAEWWQAATGPDSWLEEVDRLKFFASPEVSTSHGYYDHQLVAVGSTKREVWIRFPVAPDVEGRKPADARRMLESFSTTGEAVDSTIETIFAFVGANPQLRDGRGWLARHLAPRERPELVEWP